MAWHTEPPPATSLAAGTENLGVLLDRPADVDGRVFG